MNNLNVATYNAHGVNDVTLSYLSNIMPNYDFILLQEHWLHSSNLHIFEDKIDNIHAYGTSGMDDTEIVSGRPYGGCAILWRNYLSCQVTPIPCDNKRLCIVKTEFQTHTVLLLFICHVTLNMINQILPYIMKSCKTWLILLTMRILIIVCVAVTSTPIYLVVILYIPKHYKILWLKKALDYPVKLILIIHMKVLLIGQHL